MLKYVSMYNNFPNEMYIQYLKQNNTWNWKLRPTTNVQNM